MRRRLGYIEVQIGLFRFHLFESFQCVDSKIFGALLLWAGMNFMLAIICISMRSGLPDAVYEKVTTKYALDLRL